MQLNRNQFIKALAMMPTAANYSPFNTVKLEQESEGIVRVSGTNNTIFHHATIMGSIEQTVLLDKKRSLEYAKKLKTETTISLDDFISPCSPRNFPNPDIVFADKVDVTLPSNIIEDLYTKLSCSVSDDVTQKPLLGIYVQSEVDTLVFTATNRRTMSHTTLGYKLDGTIDATVPKDLFELPSKISMTNVRFFFGLISGLQNRYAQALYTDTTTGITHCRIVQTIEDKFPLYKNILNKERCTDTYSIKSSELKKALDLLKTAKTKRHESQQLYFSAKNGSLTIATTFEDGTLCTGNDIPMSQSISYSGNSINFSFYRHYYEHLIHFGETLTVEINTDNPTKDFHRCISKGFQFIAQPCDKVSA